MGDKIVSSFQGIYMQNQHVQKYESGLFHSQTFDIKHYHEIFIGECNEL